MQRNLSKRVYGGLKIEPLKFNDPRLYKLLCYPLVKGNDAESKIRELRELGVIPCIGGNVELHGGLRVLGKGTVGIVTYGLMGNEIVALKILRCDANRRSLEKEAKILQVVNNAGIGPKLILHSKNFLVMEFVHGHILDNFLLKGSYVCIARALKKLFWQCFRLDSLGIDHGELSTPKKHIFVHRCNPTIVDFETASFSRKVSNLTAIIGHIFFKKTLVSERMRLLFNIDIKKLEILKESLRLYKEKPNINRFNMIEDIIFGLVK